MARIQAGCDFAIETFMTHLRYRAIMRSTVLFDQTPPRGDVIPRSVNWRAMACEDWPVIDVSHALGQLRELMPASQQSP